jgi:hypothetical protein
MNREPVGGPAAQSRGSTLPQVPLAKIELKFPFLTLLLVACTRLRTFEQFNATTSEGFTVRVMQ